MQVKIEDVERLMDDTAESKAYQVKQTVSFGTSLPHCTCEWQRNAAVMCSLDVSFQLNDQPGYT